MLQAVGVSAEDEAVYRTLLRTPECTVRELVEASGRDRTALRRSLTRLEDLGLLSRTAHRPARLIPARPDVAVEVLVARQQAQLERTRSAARALVAEMRSPARLRPENLVEVIVGQQAIANRFVQLVNGTESEVLALDRPPYAVRQEDAGPHVRGRLGVGVRVRGIYAPESLELPGALEEAIRSAEDGEESRVHPQVPIKLTISDRSVALLPLAMDEVRGSALVVRESALVEALVQLWHLLWEQAVPIVPGTADGEPVTDSRLLTLLASGMKDEAIARQLELSSRTVGRRVADLMETLGARTRFQAGVQAERRRLLGG
ncbi:helix-turn-helix domain-containing protein [Nocardioides sp. TF02-7]|uniref:helix-turn-helix domain-containing protein n=1 Tax=Nocardioides sp. TF02-7 TaxID=2917724 RepID=UPI001F064CFE|nr:helix-turn-helix domain-containing protein [Nocardioides sp. TF02-7]UMG93554.1 LuxR C-terminal-related transcriptional regulator [Nocardioides sp. TF02-7]